MFEQIGKHINLLSILQKLLSGVSIRSDRNLVTWAKSNLTSDHYREVLISHMH